MKKIILALTLVLFPLNVCFADLSAALSTQLQRKPAQLLNERGHGLSVQDADALLLKAYENRGFVPFWIEGSRPSDRAEAARAVLETAHEEGLNPLDYHVNVLNKFWNNTDEASLAKIDIVLTVAIARFTADLRAGRSDAKRANPKLFASAHDVEVDLTETMKQALYAEDIRAHLKNQAPPTKQYARLKQLLAELRQVEKAGGWGTVSAGETLKPGMNSPRVAQLRKRLAASGDLSSDSGSTSFDSELEAGVKKFQERHGLKADGAVGKGTIAALNIPASERIKQVEINMERWRWNARDLGGKHAIVNIASYQAGVTKDEKVSFYTRAIVGKTYHKTPVFSDQIQYVEFNPYWNVPTSIAKNEYLPKLRKDPAAVKAKGIRIFTRWGDESSEIDPTSVNWNNISKSEIAKYHLRQEPGPKNALGKVKIMFPNDHNVYLHDTPTHSLFERTDRTFSHGCIRLNQPLEMATEVLGDLMTIEKAKSIVDSKKRTIVKLDQPLPVHITYRTVVVRDDGTVRFLQDVYGRDKELARIFYG